LKVETYLPEKEYINPLEAEATRDEAISVKLLLLLHKLCRSTGMDTRQGNKLRQM